MPSFEYDALDARGRVRRGMITAETARSARQELRRLKLTPVDISSPRQETTGVKNAGRVSRISSGALVSTTRQLAVLIGASTPLEEALSVVALQSENVNVRKRLLIVRERVMEGWQLSDALGEDPHSFSELYRAVVAAGESSGDLAGVLDRLATMLEKNRSMQNKAIGALVYPAALILIAGGVVTALMTQVVPRIIEQFNSFGAELPLITRIVVSISDFLGAYGIYLLICLFALTALFWWSMKLPATKREIDRRLLGLPLMGKLLRGLDGARFARTLSTLFSGGAPLLESLEGARRTIANSYMRDKLGGTISMVREGASVSAALKRTGVLPPMMAPMIAAGERSGVMPSMLDKTALQLEEEFDAASTIVLRLLEPAIIIMMGGVILVIVVSILLPILQLNSLAAG